MIINVVLIICGFFCFSFIFCQNQPLLVVEPKICRPTTRDIIGPYYLPGAPFRRQICDKAPGYDDLDRLLVEGKVLDERCSPIEGAKIEVWQADREGHYLLKDNCRGYFYSSRGGHYAFLTIHPGKYSISKKKSMFRPAHIHYRVSNPGHNILITQMYFKGDTNLGRNDSCGRCNSEHNDIVVETENICADRTDKYCFLKAHFDIVLRTGEDVSVNADSEDSMTELIDLAAAGK